VVVPDFILLDFVFPDFILKSAAPGPTLPTRGGKHGGQKGMPKPEPRPQGGKDQGIVCDERGQEQPRDKARAQQVSRQDKGGDPPGQKS